MAPARDACHNTDTAGSFRLVEACLKTHREQQNGKRVSQLFNLLCGISKRGQLAQQIGRAGFESGDGFSLPVNFLRQGRGLLLQCRKALAFARVGNATQIGDLLLQISQLLTQYGQPRRGCVFVSPFLGQLSAKIGKICHGSMREACTATRTGTR